MANMQKQYSTTAIVIIAALVVGVVVVLSGGGKDFLGFLKLTSTPGQVGGPTAVPDTGYNETAVITFDGQSFSPATVSFKFDANLASTTVNPKSGQWIKIVNKSNSVIRVYSNPHPLHTDNPDLNMGVIAPGEFKIARITKKGSWSYHNHLAPSQGGTIVAN